jgi:cytochrome P450
MTFPDPASLDLTGFDLRALPPGFHDNPYPWYAALRTQSPVRAMPDGSVLLTRYRDCEAVYRDPKLFCSDKKAEFGPKFGAGSPLFEHHTTSLVFNDPPLHTRVRRLIAGALTVRATDAVEPSLIRWVDQLLDGMVGKAARGEPVDLIEDFASAIPIEVIGNLLGVPTDQRGPLRDWSLAILGALEPQPGAAQLARGHQAVTGFVAYLRGLVAQRRAQPGDPAQDVLTRLIQGEGGGASSGERAVAGDPDREQTQRLTETELLQNCIFVLNAGHETTTNLIGNGLVSLLQWPDQRQKLLAQPELIASAVEEFLRFESSNQLGNRLSTADAVVGGMPWPAGTRFTLCIGAANRDPAVVPDPERLDIARSPNRHLAFGFGAHQCVGMSLARLEGRVAIGRFLQRFPGYALAGPVQRGGRVRFRGNLRVPFQLD